MLMLLEIKRYFKLTRHKILNIPDKSSRNIFGFDVDKGRLKTTDSKRYNRVLGFPFRSSYNSDVVTPLEEVKQTFNNRVF